MSYTLCSIMLLLTLVFSMKQGYVINESDFSNVNVPDSVNMNGVQNVNGLQNMNGVENLKAGEKAYAIEKLNANPIENRTKLRVALFPYIPDSTGDGFTGLQAFIENEFEGMFPSIDLELADINPDEEGFYNLSTLTDWLTNPVTGYDVVEIDTVLLGDLVNAALIVPQRINISEHPDWLPAAATAIEFNQANYAYPHLHCAFFLFTYYSQVAQATTIDELVTSLGTVASGIQRIVGNLNSSWDLPALWIDSFKDTYYWNLFTQAQALHDYDSLNFVNMLKLAELCDILGGSNPCLDGTFRDDDYMTDLFIENQAASMFGYSERLFRIIKNGFPGAINSVKVKPLPLGIITNEPVFFTDAFVFRRHISSIVQAAANTFVQFMGSPYMQAAVVGSGDNPNPNRIPRYLLPASKLAYDHPFLLSDPIYQNVFRQLNGTSYPTTGFYNEHKKLYNVILQHILQ